MTYADRIPAPRPVPTTRQRLTDARQSSLSLTQEIAHRLRTHQWYDNPKFPILHEPSAHGTHEGTGFTTDCAICTKKIDAIAAVAASVISERPDTARCGHTPEQHRHDDGQAADAASHDRAIRELTAELDRTRDERNERLTLAESSRLAKRYDQAATERDEARAELGSAQELLAVVDDLAEQLDRARARYATRPEVTPVEADGEPHEDPKRLRQQLADAHADCARYATERDEARSALADPLRTAAKDLRLLADQHSIDSLGFGIGWAADRLDHWANTPDEAAPPSSVPPHRAQDEHARGYSDAIAYLRDDERYMHWWSSTGVQPDGPVRRHLADYLETVGPDGPDVTAPPEARP